MRKLRLCTYLKVLNYNKINDKTSGQRKILNALISSICNEEVNITAPETSKIIKGTKDVEGHIRDKIEKIGYHNIDYYEEQFVKRVVPLLHPGKINDVVKTLAYIIKEDNEISANCVVDYVSNIKKQNVYSVTDSIKFIAGVLLYVLKCTNNVRCEDYAADITPDFCDFASSKNVLIIEEDSSFSVINTSDIESLARAFCIEYENEMDFLPLCQIANFVDDLHKYTRDIYTDYNKCPKEVQAKILELKDVNPLDFHNEIWIDQSVDLFDRLIHEKDLCDSNFLYEGAKYFHRAFSRYSNLTVDFDPYSFHSPSDDEIAGLKFSKLNLNHAINEYLYLKENNPEKDISSPIDVVWKYCSKITTEEHIATFWVCMIIISTCHWLYDEDQTDIDIGDAALYIDTQEDMYLYALLELYKLYYSSEYSDYQK